MATPENDSRIRTVSTTDSTTELVTTDDMKVTTSTRKGIKVFWFTLPAIVVNIIVSVLTVTGSVAEEVVLPMYSNSIMCAGGDPYAVLFYSSLYAAITFPIVTLIYRVAVDPTSSLMPSAKLWVLGAVGALTCVNGLMVVYASPTTRTPAYLQAILPTTAILYTVIARYLVLRKGISKQRLVCLGVVLVGMFISSEPTIFNIDAGSEDSSSQSLSSRILWPMIFALGFVPVAIIYVLTERELKQESAQSLSFMSWTAISQLVCMVAFLPSDFIPDFGMAGSAGEFRERFTVASLCHFGQVPDYSKLSFNITTTCPEGMTPEEACSQLLPRSLLFLLAYLSANLFVTLLVRYAEGATYTSIVNSLSTPLGAIFWTCFFSQQPFAWSPRFNETAAFTLVGLVIMVPGVMAYNYFSIQETEKQEMEQQILKLSKKQNASNVENGLNGVY